MKTYQELEIKEKLLFELRENINSREEAFEKLKDFSIKELDNFLFLFDLPKTGNKLKKINSIIEATVGFKLRSKAIQTK